VGYKDNLTSPLRFRPGRQKIERVYYRVVIVPGWERRGNRESEGAETTCSILDLAVSVSGGPRVFTPQSNLQAGAQPFAQD